MKNLKKFAVSLAAFTTALSLGVGTLSVTADEIKKDASKTFAEKAFVANFNDTKYKDVAKYLVDNGMSLKDAEAVMSMYIAADEEKQTPKIGYLKSSTPTPQFYSDTNLSKNQHYCVIVSKNGAYKNNNFHKSLMYAENSEDSMINSLGHLNIKNLSSGVNITGDVVSGLLWDLIGRINLTGKASKKVGVCEFQIYTTDSSTNEKEMYEQLHWEDEYLDNNGNLKENNLPLRYHTYVQGDVKHDGIVDGTDLQWLIDYNMGKNPETVVKYVYTYPNPDAYGNAITINFDTDIARIINNLAKDADRNGTIDLADVTWIVKNADVPIYTKK